MNVLTRVCVGIAMAFFAGTAWGEDGVQVFQADPPASHDQAVQRAVDRDVNKAREERRQGHDNGRVTQSRTIPGKLAVRIPLDDTGIADWSFLNPRNPVIVPADVWIEFDNDTADRTFEVSMSLTVRPGDTTPDDVDRETGRDRETAPLTVPLLVHRALRYGSAATPSTHSTIAQHEQDMVDETVRSFPQFTEQIRHVHDLETHLRARSALRAAEADARTKVTKLSADPNSTLDALAEARTALEDLTRKRELADAVIAGMSTNLEGLRAGLIKALQRRSTDFRQQRRRTADAARREFLTTGIVLHDVAIDALKNQSDETALLAPVRLKLRGALLEDCTITAGVATCSATIRVYPSGSAALPHRVLLQQAKGATLAKFTVRFFEEEETPARQVGYLLSATLQNRVASPESSATVQAVASVGAAFDPFVEDRSATSRNCPLLCPDKPYEGQRRTHYTGTGRLEVTQTFGNLFDGKVSLGYTVGDLGGPTSSTNIKLSQYRFNLYSLRGITFHYGKFNFAAPSSGIAINEIGEGFRLAYKNLAASHITKRESATNAADAANRDDEVWTLEALNMPLWKPIRKLLGNHNRIRTISLIGLYGNDRKRPETKDHPVTKLKEELFSEHSYLTYGGQIGFTMPGRLYGTVAGYRSRREADQKDAPCNQTRFVCDGEGDVGLFTATRPFSVDEDGKAKRTLTFSLGLGSGDNPETTTVNEGYIGETAGYGPDHIFLSSIASGLSTRPFVAATPLDTEDQKKAFMASDIGAIGLGRGLSNKRYLGLKYVDNNFSVLELIAVHILQIPKTDIRSKVTIVTLNDYRLRYPLIAGLGRDAGRELDLEFQVETPRAVKVGIKAGYYWAGEGLKTILRDDVWSASGTISISL